MEIKKKVLDQFDFLLRIGYLLSDYEKEVLPITSDISYQFEFSNAVIDREFYFAYTYMVNENLHFSHFNFAKEPSQFPYNTIELQMYFEKHLNLEYNNRIPAGNDFDDSFVQFIRYQVGFIQKYALEILKGEKWIHNCYLSW